MIVRELLTKLGYDLKDAPFRKYEAQVQAFKHGAIAVAAVASAAGAAVFGVVKSAANYGEHLLVTSQKLGIAIDTLQRLQFAAKLANVGNDELAVSLRFLSKNIDEARHGSKEAQKSFKRLGIDPKTAKVNEDLLERMAQGFINLKDPAAQIAVAQQLLGRSGSNLLPLLKEGPEAMRKYFKEAGRFGLVTEEDAKLADEFNDNIERLTLGMGMLKNRIGLALMPAMEKALVRFLDWYDVNRKIIEQRTAAVFTAVSNALSRLWRIVKAGYGAVERLVEAMGGFDKAAARLGPVGIALGVILGAINPVTIAVVGLSAVIALLADDFLSFKEGQRHVLPWRKIIDGVTESVQYLEDTWSGLTIVVGGLLDTFKQINELNPFAKAAAGLQYVADLILKVAGFAPGIFRGTDLGKAVNAATVQGAKDGSTPATIAAKGIGGLAALGREARGADRQVLPLQGMAGPPAPYAGAGAAQHNSKVSIDQKINVTVDGGGDPEKIAAAIKGAVKDENKRAWTSMMKNMQPGTSN